MHDDPDPLQPDGEQMMRLDQLQPLVEHGGTVDADLGAHVPVRMGDRLFGRDLGQILYQPQGSAAGRQRDRADIFDPAALQALENCIVFAVHRQQRGAVAAHCSSHDLACGNQRFLVGQGDGAALLDRSHGRAKSGTADDRGHRQIDRACRRFAQRGPACRGLDAAIRQRLAQIGKAALVGHYGNLGPELARCRSKRGDLAIRRQRDHTPVVAVAADKV